MITAAVLSIIASGEERCLCPCNISSWRNKWDSGPYKLLLGTKQYRVGFENRVEYGELPLHISAVFPGPLACDEMREWDSDHSAWSAHLEHCCRKELRDNYPTIKATLFLLSPILDTIVCTENAVLQIAIFRHCKIPTTQIRVTSSPFMSTMILFSSLISRTS